MKFKLACVQLNSSDDMSANIAQIKTLVLQAIEAGADLIALPENTFLMLSQTAIKQEISLELHEGVVLCRTLAEQYGVWILIGSLPLNGGNNALLINDKGEIVTAYQKIHLFDVDLPSGESYRESNRFAAGEQAVLVHTPWGKLGITICYDVRFPHLYRALAKAGADFLAVPAAFTEVTGKAHWHVLLRARAIENGCFVLAPAQCGEHAGKRRTYGHSLIIDPWGEVLAEGGENPGIIMAEIETSKVAEIRARIPSLQHDRGFRLCNIS